MLTAILEGRCHYYPGFTEETQRPREFKPVAPSHMTSKLESWGFGRAAWLQNPCSEPPRHHDFSLKCFMCSLQQIAGYSVFQLSITTLQIILAARQKSRQQLHRRAWSDWHIREAIDHNCLIPLYGTFLCQEFATAHNLLKPINQNLPLFITTYFFHRELNGLRLYYFVPVVNLDCFHWLILKKTGIGYPHIYILVQLNTSLGQIPKTEAAQSKVLTRFKALDAYLKICWQRLHQFLSTMSNNTHLTGLFTVQRRILLFIFTRGKKNISVLFWFAFHLWWLWMRIF